MSRSFGDQRPRRPHLVTDGKGGVGGEVGDLRTDVETGFTTLEAELDAAKAASGLLAPVDVATAAALNAYTAAGSGATKTLTQNAPAVENIDGQVAAVGMRVLVDNDGTVTGADRGVYVVTTVGTGVVAQVLTRADDFNTSAKAVPGTLVRVERGTAKGNTIWQLTNTAVVLETTALDFDKIYPHDHADRHILGAADEVDGDRVDVDMTPANYTPDAGVPEAGDVNHLAAHLGGIDNEIGTIYAKTGAPMVRGFRAAGGTLSADGSEDATVLGEALLQGQTFAQVTLGASLDIIAEAPGTPGNALSVEVVDTGGAGPSTVAYAAGKLTIDLVGLTPDEDAIATLINTTGAWDGIFRANSGGGAAFGTVAETPLVGGTGSGLSVYVGGGLCAPAGEAGAGATSNASVTDTTIVVDVPDLTALTPALAATTDDASIWIESNGKVSNSISKTLA